MKKTFSIEFEVHENEKITLLEKLRNHLLQSGYIVQCETNSQIDFYRPLPTTKNKEEMIYAWINKIHIVAEKDSIKIVCHITQFKTFRFLTMVLPATVEIPLAILLYFLRVNPIIVALLLLSGIATPFLVYFIFLNLYKQTIKFFAEEIQKVVG
ncbi:MAG: hypothetical protein N3G21_10670 [Candidatus Hydrogenedentes bacterium]|nr:hypothetical protein [Candidatus Hydrogenedentota bacterium]